MTEPLLSVADRFTHLVSCEESVVLVGEDEATLLDLPEAADIVRLADGSRTAHGIARALASEWTPPVVHFVILVLLGQGVLEEVSMRDTARGPSRAPAGSPIGPIAETLEAAWADRAGAAVELAGSRVGLTGVRCLLTDDYLRPGLVAPAEPEPAGESVLLLRPGRERVWFGPSLTYGTGPCVACLQQRLRLNLTGRALLHVAEADGDSALEVEVLERATPTRAFVLLAEALAGASGGLGGDSELPDGELRALNLDGGPETRHPVSRLPDCPVCGNPSLGPPGADLQLRSRPKAAGPGTGYRTVTPERTWRRLSGLVSPLTGVVRHVRRVDFEGSDLVHVHTAGHAAHHGPGSVKAVRADRRDPSGGKGTTEVEARVSALCEALERISSVHRGTEPVREARFSELEGDAVHPHELLLFSHRQYRLRDAANADDPAGFHWIPEPYDDEPVDWVEARSLASDEVRLVPAAYVYMGFQGHGRRFCKADSNGLAAGNCLEEAILQGFLELAERDAVALWWYNRVRLPGVDLASFGDPWVDAVVERYPSWGRTLWALDISTDLGIPCFAALSARSAGPEEVIFGFGAHLDASVALRRALAELNQMLPTVARDREERRHQLLPDFQDALDWWDTATLAAHPYLTPRPDRRPTRREDFERPETADLRDDVLVCVDRAVTVGLDVLAHDLSRPGLGLSVARVMAPGLRHFWRRLGPGRLYDVPVELGWVDAPRGEEDMNPVSVFV